MSLKERAKYVLTTKVNRNLVVACIFLFVIAVCMHIIWILFALANNFSITPFIESISIVGTYFITLFICYFIVHFSIDNEDAKEINRFKKFIKNQPVRNKLVFTYVTVIWVLYVLFKLFPDLDDLTNIMTIISLVVWPPLVWAFTSNK